MKDFKMLTVSEFKEKYKDVKNIDELIDDIALIVYSVSESALSVFKFFLEMLVHRIINKIALIGILSSITLVGIILATIYFGLTSTIFAAMVSVAILNLFALFHIYRKVSLILELSTLDILKEPTNE